MASNQHLKRNVMPASWAVKKKNIQFITRPKPGSHKLQYVVPMIVLLRDELKLAKTTREAKYILHNTEVFVNGKKVQDIKYPVGLFDVIEFKETKEKLVLLFNTLGRIKLSSVKDSLLFLKISSKTVLPSKKFQINFSNGFNLSVSEKDFKAHKVNDTIVYDYEKKKVVANHAYKEGAQVYIFDGKFQGNFAQVKEFTHFNGIAKDNVSIEIGKELHTTAKQYCFALGKDDVKRFA